MIGEFSRILNDLRKVNARNKTRNSINPIKVFDMTQKEEAKISDRHKGRDQL